MKLRYFQIKILVMALFFVTSAGNALMAQTKSKMGGDQTISMKVYGVCGECKERIESTALDVKGVKKAEWDMKTDTLVCVGTSKMDKQKIAEALAKAGHKSELSEADPKGYANLPACCQYDSGQKKH